MISEHLFNEVMGVKILEELVYDDTYIAYAVPSDETHYYWENINIYELAHKCKEWANNKGYEIVETIDICYVFDDESDNVFNTSTPDIHFDIERVFRSCEWILERIKNEVK